MKTTRNTKADLKRFTNYASWLSITEFLRRLNLVKYTPKNIPNEYARCKNAELVKYNESENNWITI